MASNFKFFSHLTKNSLHLKLYGDFDGNSALELLSALTEYGNSPRHIFIDTNDLNNIYPFGKDIFQNNLGAMQSNNLTFLGKNKHSLML
jgi:hypothetical protein